jgi:hypothetical protein
LCEKRQVSGLRRPGSAFMVLHTSLAPVRLLTAPSAARLLPKLGFDALIGDARRVGSEEFLYDFKAGGSDARITGELTSSSGRRY